MKSKKEKPRRSKATKRYHYVCLKCWRLWTDTRNFEKCPRCKSDKLDKQEELIL